jgi:hypothetical protein
MSDDEYSQMAGQIDTALPLEDLTDGLSSNGVRVQVRESSHYEGGRYVRVYEGAYFTFERIGPTEYLARGDADSVEQMHKAASAVSWALSELDLRHRFEVYDSGARLVHYLHHHWPEGEAE